MVAEPARRAGETSRRLRLNPVGEAPNTALHNEGVSFLHLIVEAAGDLDLRLPIPLLEGEDEMLRVIPST